MTETRLYDIDVVNADGGQGGFVTAPELFGPGRKVSLIDYATEDRRGGLARGSFGGNCVLTHPNNEKSGSGTVLFPPSATGIL